MIEDSIENLFNTINNSKEYKEYKEIIAIIEEDKEINSLLEEIKLFFQLYYTIECVDIQYPTENFCGFFAKESRKNRNVLRMNNRHSNIGVYK